MRNSIVRLAQRLGRRLGGCHRRRGASMVEFAIILPVLVALLFGLIEFGWLFFKMAQINQAARHGARVAVRPAADNAEVEAAVEDIMDGADLGMAKTDYRLTIFPSTDVEVGEPVQIYVELDYSTIKLIGFIPTPAIVHGRVTMSKEGP
jgi:Flp pilus assembly protein TadG